MSNQALLLTAALAVWPATDIEATDRRGNELFILVMCVVCIAGVLQIIH